MGAERDCGDFMIWASLVQHLICVVEYIVLFYFMGLLPVLLGKQF